MAKRTYHHSTPKKDRKISETDRAFYKLGFQDGERQLERTIILLKTTNKRLWDELTRLDRVDPVAGVLVPEVMAHRIIKVLRKPMRNYHLAKKLKKLLQKEFITL